MISKTKLWERSQFNSNGNSPFGLCLVNTDDTNGLFNHSETYQPDYFPEGMMIDVLTHEKSPFLPWTFRLPFKGKKKKTDEPRDHQNKIMKLTRSVFGVPYGGFDSGFVDFFDQSPVLSFKNGPTVNLMLEFDHGEQGKSKSFESLNLTINY